jgi:hypothetical protein
MRTPEEWADTKTDVILLTCDGKGVKAKRDALIKLLREVQVDCFRQMVEDERVRQESMAYIQSVPLTDD